MSEPRRLNIKNRCNELSSHLFLCSEAVPISGFFRPSVCPKCLFRSLLGKVPLQHFLIYMNLALKNTYHLGFWLSNSIKHCQGGHLGG